MYWLSLEVTEALFGKVTTHWYEVIDAASGVCTLMTTGSGVQPALVLAVMLNCPDMAIDHASKTSVDKNLVNALSLSP